MSEVQPGVFFRIKQLSASPEMTKRLRELGFCENQQVRLVSREINVICEICHARVGLSSELAKSILVEPLASKKVRII